MTKMLLITNVDNRAIAIENGLIVDIFSMENFDISNYPNSKNIDASGYNLRAGLIDTHIHGIGGYATDDAKSSSIFAMSEKLASFGVTGFFPTLYAANPDKMITEINAVVEAIGKEKGARILGINLEGPFLNPAKCGAQSPEGLCKPSTDIINSLIKAGKGYIKAITIAPELKDIDKIIDIATNNGIIVSLGHTNASYDQACNAIEMGAKNITHAFNAMSPLNHREPGVAGAALFNDNVCCELIADGKHVDKNLVCHTIKTKPKDKTILVSDSLGITATAKESYMANGIEVMLKDNVAVSKENPSLLCGSALTLNKAVKNVIDWGINENQAFRMASSNPAKLYSLKKMGQIKKGYKADVVLFDKNMDAICVIIDGEVIDEHF
ncbi:MAG: N-acetylglucosamine-6-phosphate deacetylase [Sphaerochaetaceae bacterium]|nr:N-acetylglucosamine-6-phosphate deacetylase [Sphaerochaetaceae bacterium]